MTVRELKKKLDDVPDEYLDSEVYTRDYGDGYWASIPVTDGVRILRSKCQARIFPRVFLGIGEYHGVDAKVVWPEEDQ